MAKKISLLVAAALASALLAAPVEAAPAFKTLGTDPKLDAAPSFDLTELSVAKMGQDLEIRIGIDGMLPVVGSAVPLLPGVQWAFDVKKKTYVAEAYVHPVEGPGYLLFERKGNVYTQIMSLEGTYDFQDGFVSLRVPLKKIGARKGTVISGTGKKGTEDVDFHIHAGPHTEYADTLSTTKDFVVP